MAAVARIPRRRAALCGLLLILLGAWGALIPFIGPYLKFAYTPDTAWSYTSGRLYLSVLPGAAALLGGLLVLATRSRAVGIFGGLLATAGGAWFIVGAGVLDTLLKQTSITPGLPVSRSVAGLTPAGWIFLEQLGFFVAVGILIVLFGALAMGRFSMVSARDPLVDDYDDYAEPPEEQGTASQFPSATGQFPASTGQYPASAKPFPGEEPTQTQERLPSSSTGPFGSSSSTSNFPPPSS
jgi:hypothetical protein